MELLFGQFLVLAFTLVAWWLAKRDLTAQAAQAQTPVTAEWEQLREAVETLIADLERRATAAEQRVAAAERRLRQIEGGAVSPGAGLTPPSAPDFSVPTEPQAPEEPPAAPDERYAPVYALADAGVADPVEIARRTGLSRGEVELILGLRARRR